MCEGSNVGEYNEECGGDAMMRLERERIEIKKRGMNSDWFYIFYSCGV